MSTLTAARLDAIPELRDAINTLTEQRNRKIDELLRSRDHAEMLFLAGEVSGLNLTIAAPYKPRQRTANAA